MFLFAVTETKGQQYLWGIHVFFYLAARKKGRLFQVEKQGGDAAGSVNSCVMSETVKHAGEGVSGGLVYEMICV